MKDKIILYGSFCLVILVGIFYIFNQNEEKVEFHDIKKTISVDVKGAVKNPGVKKMEIGSNVEDLIKESGGLLESADTDTINLSKQLTDEMVVAIYTKEEVQSITSGNNYIKVIDKECTCPVVKNDVCKNPEFTKIEGTNKISLNHASKEELMTLSNIGEAKAKKIIEYREQTPFQTIDEIMNVKGIGKSIFEKIKDYITI